MAYLGNQITTVFPSAISIDTATISGNTTIGGTLGVTGASTLSSTLGVTGVSTLSDNIVFDASSKGVHLGVTSATASNLLDDYEEGTYTPTITGSSSAGTVSTSVLHGEYTKIGRIVHFGVYIYFTSTHSGSGAMQMNLPFTATSAQTGFCGGGTVVYKLGWTGNGPDIFQIQAGTNYGFVRYDTNTGVGDMLTHIQNTAQMMIFGNFLV